MNATSTPPGPGAASPTTPDTFDANGGRKTSWRGMFTRRDAEYEGWRADLRAARSAAIDAEMTVLDAECAKYQTSMPEDSRLRGEFKATLDSEAKTYFHPIKASRKDLKSFSEDAGFRSEKLAGFHALARHALHQVIGKHNVARLLEESVQAALERNRARLSAFEAKGAEIQANLRALAIEELNARANMRILKDVDGRLKMYTRDSEFSFQSLQTTVAAALQRRVDLLVQRYLAGADGDR
ncbi:hypothetical protein [Noviherbaspirillum galbum]|uniref:Uncharacterized protein n=1 Tax=Noviherbaspirillum galbum TaxID=2709383 RepID=A0A6B3SKB6_9BURK|nr:hypothetical protein [Noviherbaspirillum galbum]NEX61190.1 hypothetical protein [Noviherbaspirillum galbum]